MRCEMSCASRRFRSPRSRLTQSWSLRFTLLSETQMDKAKELIEQARKGLSFRGKSSEEGRVTLVYGLSEAEAGEIERSAITRSVEDAAHPG